jgi:hypothetical protein
MKIVAEAPHYACIGLGFLGGEDLNEGSDWAAGEHSPPPVLEHGKCPTLTNAVAVNLKLSVTAVVT